MVPWNATNPNVTCYRELGWSKKCEIIWMTLPEAVKALSVFKYCGCKRWCKGRCICRKIELPCTELWKCSGTSSQWSVFVWSIRSDNKHYILFWYIFCYDMVFVYWILEVLGEFWSIKSAFLLAIRWGSNHYIFTWYNAITF